MVLEEESFAHLYKINGIIKGKSRKGSSNAKSCTEKKRVK